MTLPSAAFATRRRSGLRIVVGLAFAAVSSCAVFRPAAPSDLEPPPPAVETEPPAPTAVEPPPAPVEPPPAVVPEPQPPAPPLPPRGPALVRIGLASDLESITLPCCDGELSVDLGTQRLDVLSPLTLRPGAASVGGISYRVQVAALREEVQARDMATRIERLSGESAEVRFDALGGLYRVRVGRYPTREAADAGGQELLRHGVATYWIVTEGAALADAAIEVSHRGVAHRVAGRRFVFAASGDGAVRWEGKRYRGRLVVFLNDRGRLNLINELPVEQYLRGVVPRELGPDAYPEIEALKAQAIAARSYTLRNLGEFAEEGYDLCGTPRCQVYGGMDAEHPLSDRAVAETAGQVIVHDGQAIDALYSATCGGHTENVEVIFPLKRAPYLRGVACIEAGVALLGASSPPGAAFPDLLLSRVLPDWPAARGSRTLDAATLERALFDLAAAAGLAVPSDRLASLDRAEVHRFLGSVFDLAADSRLFVRGEELDYLVSNPPPGWGDSDLRFAAYLVKSGLLASPPTAGSTRLTSSEASELLLQLATFLHRLEHRAATFASVGAGELVARDEGTELHLKLPATLVTVRELGGERTLEPLKLLPADELDLYLLDGELAAVVQHVDPRGATFDRAHKRTSWTRFKSDEDLRKAVATRLPGFSFRSFEILSRGVSGRVGKIRLHGTTGETIEVEGLPVRWTLDVPDTFFTARRLTPKTGAHGYQFSGRGWGHGVGLCQTGSYGMALRGHDAAAIVAHYYRGTTLATIEYEALR